MAKQFETAQLEASRSAILQRLQAAPDAWLSAKQCLDGSEAALPRAAFDQLRAEQRVVELGRKGSATMYGAPGEGQSRQAFVLELAARYLDRLERGRAALQNRLQPIPLSGLQKENGPKHLPMLVRSALIEALEVRLRAGQAFNVPINGQVSGFLFASDLRATLQSVPSAVGIEAPVAAGSESSQAPTAAVSGACAAVAHVPTSPVANGVEESLAAAVGTGAALAAPVVPSSAVLGEQAERVADRVRSVYWALRKQTGLRNVDIARIAEESGVGRDALHAFLNNERRARRANATLGEPSIATPEELAVALSIDGLPHLYIELYE